MRSFLTTICVAVLMLLVIVPVAAESTDAEVRAARAAERSESVRMEQKLNAPAEQVNVTVTETPHSGSSEAHAKANDKDSDTTSAHTKAHSHARTDKTSDKASDKVGKSDEKNSSAKSDRSDEPKKADKSKAKADEKPDQKPLAVAAAHRNRPDKVALMIQDEKSGKAERKQPGSLATVLSTILKLAVVLILAYLTILALKWFSTRNEAMPSNNRQLKVLDTLRFNSTSSMHLVEIKGTKLLVGCTSGQVNVLKEFAEDELSGEGGEPAGKFAEYLAKYSDMSAKHGPSGRVAGLLRDCTGYLRNRCQGTRMEARDEK